MTNDGTDYLTPLRACARGYKDSLVGSQWCPYCGVCTADYNSVHKEAAVPAYFELVDAMGSHSNCCYVFAWAFTADARHCLGHILCRSYGTSRYHSLDHGCNKYCDLIGQKQVSISHINL